MKTQCLIGMAGLLFAVTSVAQEATITVAPELTDEILATPGMGWWAEWHMSQSDCAMPAPATQRAIVDAYLQAFRQTTLLVLMGGGEMLTYAAGRRPQGVRATGAAARSPLWPVSPVDRRGRCQ